MTLIKATDQVYIIKEKLAQLDQSLLQELPTMPSILKEIHSILKKDPTTVTLLSEEDCSTIIKGLKKQTGTEIAVAALKKKGKKPLSQITLDDL